MEFNDYINSLPKAKADRLPPEEFFNLIIETEETVNNFIKELFAPAVKGRASLNLSTSYHGVIAAYTNDDSSNITKNRICNFTAFSAAILHKFRITRLELKALIEDSKSTLNKPKRNSYSKEASSKSERPTAKMYFKEMSGSRESIIAFIQEHLAPAVAGRAIPNVGGAYYGALAKNSNETATDIVHNTACNYQAFKKRLETYSISPDELSELLKVDVKYKPEQKAKNKPVSKKEQVLNILRNRLSEYMTDNEKLELLIQNIYAELKPIMNKTK